MITTFISITLIKFSRGASKYFSQNSETMDNIHNKSSIIIFKTAYKTLADSKKAIKYGYNCRKKKYLSQIKLQFKQELDILEIS